MFGYLATNRRLRRENEALRRELAWEREQSRAEQADLAMLRGLLAGDGESAGRHAATSRPAPAPAHAVAVATPQSPSHSYFAEDDDTQVIPQSGPWPAAE